jgi:acetyl-CoA carboxylase carboxyl transferase subunit alpha
MKAKDRILAARAQDRALGGDYIKGVFNEFTELHGDRYFGDDPAIIGGIGRLNKEYVTVIAQEKGKTTKERSTRNFGSAHPEGYRKALRLMKEAEKFGRPIISFVDTAGAFCGIGAEERGQGHAIAQNLMEMMTLKVPSLSVFIGEGGSGGALGIAVTDEVWMLENAFYSVISPEGCASILWKDASRSEEAAECLKLTADDLLKLGVIEKIIPEEGLDFQQIYDRLKVDISEFILNKKKILIEDLLNARYEKFRKIK